MHGLDLADPGQRSLGEILHRQAERIPDSVYLVADDERVSYGRANELANAYAAGLRELGVAQGDTVAFLMNTCAEFVFATFGVMKLGAIWVPTNIDYKGDWLRQSLQASRARVLLVDANLLPRVAALGGGLPFEHVVVRGAGEVPDLGVPMLRLADLETSSAGEPPKVEIHYGDTAAVLWTSGTTGRAKGVMQSHNAWVRGAVSGAETTGTRPGDFMYCCLPMYNSAAWVVTIYRALVTGLGCGIDPEFSASRFWQRCRHYGATQIFTLGAMHMFLWQAETRPDDANNPVRHATLIPLPEDLIAPFKKRFGIETLDQGYGQSEALGILQRFDDGKPKKAGSLGKPIAGVEVKLLDDDDREVATGAVGEFCLRPTEPYVLFNGYFHDPDATLRAYSNLWYHTGDLGRRDDEGDWFFVDRKADFMRYKGRNVSSFAVEAAVMAHPAVAACAAHGVASDELASESEIKVVAVLAPDQPLNADELARFVNDTAPHFFVPRYIEFLDDLPRTPTGRVQKFKLRERGITPSTWDARKAGFVVTR